jgi:hypothetical protein
MNLMKIVAQPKFNPDVLYVLYKQVRNCLRKHSPDSVIAHSIGALHKAAQGGYEVMRYYQPWNILLLIKWTIQEADSVSHRRPAAKLDDVHKALNTLQEMGAHVRMPTEYEHHHFFMRHLAFQQFWLQHPANVATIARQELLFCSLPQNHSFQRDFFRLTGIRCAEFTLLSFVLAVMFISDSKRTTVKRENFSNLDPKLISETLDIFLSKISKDTPSLHDIMANDLEGKKSIVDQLISPTPLVNFPLWKAGQDFIAYHPTLLFRSLENYIYRILKADNPGEFQAKFGLIFEKHVESCLSNSNVSFMQESELTKTLGGSGKCVDFLIVEDDCNILIDAKGVEISQLGRVAHEPEIVFRSLKSSVQKAIKQGMGTAQRIAAAHATGEKLFGKSKNFLLIVTYDSLNLGSNTEFVNMFGQKVVDDLKKEFGSPLPVPIENFFFLDIHEFEYLLAGVYEKQTTVMTALLHAQKNDSNPKTHKFLFIQHLESLLTQPRRLPCLQSAFDTLFDKSVALFPKENEV